MTLRIHKVWLVSGICLALIVVAGGLWYFLDIHEVQRFSCDFVDSNGIVLHENFDMPQIERSAYFEPNITFLVSRDEFVITTEEGNLVLSDTTTVTISRRDGKATESQEQLVYADDRPSRITLHGSCALIRDHWVSNL
jgi:hypothetical protein